MPDEKQAVKKWLREMREATNMSQADLAAAVDTDIKNIKNAESPKAGIPAGLLMLGILRAVGAVADVSLRESPLELRLRSIEATVAELPTAADLQRGLDVLRAAIDAQASRDTRPVTGTDG